MFRLNFYSRQDNIYQEVIFVIRLFIRSEWNCCAQRSYINQGVRIFY